MSLLRRSLRPRIGAQLPIKERAIRIPLWFVAVLWLARRSGWLLWRVVRRPWYWVLWAAVVGLWFLMRALTTAEANLLLLAVLLGLAGWAVHGRESFARWVQDPLDAFWSSRWRWFWRYRRGWQPALTLSGLARSVDGVQALPRLERVRTRGGVDEVLVRPLLMQRLDEYEAAAEFLAGAFGAEWCEVEEAGRRRVLLRFGTAGPRELRSSGEW
jgi:hypothetical protein